MKSNLRFVNAQGVVVARSAPQRKGAGRGHAYERLRASILDLRLRPGARIHEGTLVRELKMSRTPVREALVRLASEGLVELLPNQGARVADMPLTSLSEFFEALTLAQRATHRWAALRRTKDDLARIEKAHHRFTRVARSDPAQIPNVNRAFHAAIADAGSNTFQAAAYGQLLDQGLRLSRLTVIYDPPAGTTQRRHFDAVIADHEALLKAIRTQDASAAEQRAAAHAELFRKRVVEYLTAADEAAEVEIGG
jgi:DNA-binding GntR family transcriptional regulator